MNIEQPETDRETLSLIHDLVKPKKKPLYEDLRRMVGVLEGIEQLAKKALEYPEEQKNINHRSFIYEILCRINPKYNDVEDGGEVVDGYGDIRQILLSEKDHRQESVM